MRITTADAILHIHPNSEFVIYGDNLDGLTFLNPADLTVTQEQVDAALIELQEIRQAEVEAKANAKAALLAQLGITEEQAKLLLS